MNAISTPPMRSTYGNPASRAVADNEFEAMLVEAKQMMYAAVDRSDLDRREIKLVQDFGENLRYVGGLKSMLEIGWRCKDPAAAVAIAEICRLYALRGHATPLSWRDAFRAEDNANGVANHAQREYAFGRSRFTNARAYEALWGQRVWTERTMDALAADRPPLITVVR